MFCARFLLFFFLFFSLQNRDRHRQTDRHVTNVPPPVNPNRSPKTIEPGRTSQNFPAMRPAVYSTATSRASTLFVLFARTDKANVKPFIVRRTTWSHATRPREQTTSPRIIPRSCAFFFASPLVPSRLLFSSHLVPSVRSITIFRLENPFFSRLEKVSPSYRLHSQCRLFDDRKIVSENDYENDERSECRR